MPLGAGYEVFGIGDGEREMVRSVNSVPAELSDNKMVFANARE